MFLNFMPLQLLLVKFLVELETFEKHIQMQNIQLEFHNWSFFKQGTSNKT